MINATYASLIGKPIESLQTILREISFCYEDLPKVLPDGIFGEQTRIAVEAFQVKFGPTVTGEVDFETWEVITDVYNDVLRKNEVIGTVYPNMWFTIAPYEESEYLRTMQSMLKNIADKYGNLTDIQISGVYDDKSVALVKELQGLYAMEQTGIIDSEFWNMTERLHTSVVINAF